MRQFISRQHWPHSAAAAAIITLACIPYLRSGLIGGAQVLIFAIVNLVLWQVYRAWTPAEIRARSPRRLLDFSAPANALLAAGLAIMLADGIWFDALLESRGHSVWPTDFSRLAATLPWMALFQPLFFVAAMHAFAVRIVRHPVAAVVLVVLFAQGVTMGVSTSLSVSMLAFVVFHSGLKYLYFTLCFRHAGFAGLAIVSALIYCRHVVHLILG